MEAELIALNIITRTGFLQSIWIKLLICACNYIYEWVEMVKEKENSS
jgi:hypothetical protein